MNKKVVVRLIECINISKKLGNVINSKDLKAAGLTTDILMSG